MTNSEQALSRARKLAEAGNNESARLCLLELLKTEPDNQAALIMLGGTYFVSDMFSEAEMVFERLVLLAPGVGQISIALFNTLWKMERREEALEEIKRFMHHADNELESETIKQYHSLMNDIEQGEI